MKNNQCLQTMFVGIDPHKQTHTFCAITPFGERVGNLTFPNNVSGFKQALAKVKYLAAEHRLQPLIGVEGGGGNGEFFAQYFVKHGIIVKSVDSILVSRERRKNTHPEKSDFRDAEEVARAILTRSDRLPNIIISQNKDFAKDLNLLVKDREELVSEQTRLKNRLHATLQDGWGSMYKTIYQNDIFGVRALKFWSLHPAAVDFKKSASAKYVKPDFFKKCKTDELPKISEIQRTHIKRLICRLQNIKTELKQTEKIIKDLVEQNISYLTSMDGCGAVTAAKIYAEVNDVQRFANNSKLARYSGIAPIKNESGQTKRDVQSKRGNVRLRQAIKTIALSQIGRNGNQKGKEYFRKKVKEGKTKKQALRCLMRQITKIIFAMLVEERPYY